MHACQGPTCVQSVTRILATLARWRVRKGPPGCVLWTFFPGASFISWEQRIDKRGLAVVQTLLLIA